MTRIEVMVALDLGHRAADWKTRAASPFDIGEAGYVAWLGDRADALLAEDARRGAGLTPLPAWCVPGAQFRTRAGRVPTIAVVRPGLALVDGAPWTAEDFARQGAWPEVPGDLPSSPAEAARAFPVLDFARMPEEGSREATGSLEEQASARASEQARLRARREGREVGGVSPEDTAVLGLTWPLAD